VVLAVAVFAAAASGSTSRRATLAGKHVGVIVCTSENPFCAAWTNTLKTALTKEGATVTVLTSVFDPATDAQNMNRLIADKPDLIIMAPASATAIIPSLVRAKQAGIKVLVALGRLTPAGAKLVTASALTDDPALGKFAAENLVAGLKAAGDSKGNVIALTGTATQLNVTDRMAAFNAYMKNYPQYKIVAVEDANWDQATSAKDTQQLISKYASSGGIQGAYGMADNMAAGIIQGATQAGVPVGVAKKGLVVVGSNCLSVGIKAIKAGTEYGTATQSPATEALTAVKVATTILNGGTPPAKTYVKEYKITKANVSQFTKACTF
jgi:ABC-type sugar transport system substrate-binding protein